MKKGFTLIEIVVVIAVVAVLGTIVTEIFIRTLRGNDKARVLSSIKQNGQAVLDNMSNTIRNADNVICVLNESEVQNGVIAVVTIKNGIYTRYRFIKPVNGSINGYIFRDFPEQTDNEDIKTFLTNNKPCRTPWVNEQILTDTNTKTGVSVQTATFTKGRQAGSKDLMGIELKIGPGETAQGLGVDSFTFSTTIQLR